MTESFVLTLTQHTLTLILFTAGPMLIASLVVGILISMFQAATQISEPTLTFVPKLVVTGLILLFLGSWMAQQLLAFTIELFGTLPTLVK
jgi:flagellar biosynthetic protein FliQ